MGNELKEKLLAVVRNGIMYGTFTEDEFAQIRKCFENQEKQQLPRLVDSTAAMIELHCDKHRLNEYLNRGYLKRIKLSHRKIMVDYDSLHNFMTNGTAVRSGGEA